MPLVNKKDNTRQPKEGDKILFYYDKIGSEKFAINLETFYIHKNKDTFNGVLITTKRMDKIYPGDYPLSNESTNKPVKVICD